VLAPIRKGKSELLIRALTLCADQGADDGDQTHSLVQNACRLPGESHMQKGSKILLAQ
jgi:hypothetical protein